MAELRIFDSQGERIDEGGQGQFDERIEDFFFDGVRFALDMRLSNEAVVFFRARETETSRSEQYYAVYKFESRDALQHLGDEIKRVIEDEWGMHLDTSQDDTDVFELLVGDRSGERRDIDCPGGFDDVDDLAELVGKGTPVSVGVGSYRDACGVFNEFITDESVNQIAIADDTSGSRLDGYDVAVEVGSYTGLEPMGDTEGALERLREQRRKRLQPDDVGSSSPDGPLGLSPFVLGGIAVVALLLLGGVAAFGACTFGVDVPVACASGGGGGATVSDFNGTFDQENQRLAVSGAVSGMTNGTFGPNVTVESGGNDSLNDSVSLTVTNGTFEHRFDRRSLSPPAPGNYTITVSANGTENTTSVNITGSQIDRVRSVTGVGSLDAGAHNESAFWVDGSVSGFYNGSVEATVSLSGPVEATTNRTLTVENGSFNHSVPLGAADGGTETFTPGGYNVTVAVGDDSNETRMTVARETVLSESTVTVNSTTGFVSNDALEVQVATERANETQYLSFAVRNSSDASNETLAGPFLHAVETDEDGMARQALDVNVTRHLEPNTEYEVTAQSAVDDGSRTVRTPDAVAITDVSADGPEQGIDLTITTDGNASSQQDRPFLWFSVATADGETVDVIGDLANPQSADLSFTYPPTLESGTYDVTVVAYGSQATTELTVESDQPGRSVASPAVAPNQRRTQLSR